MNVRMMFVAVVCDVDKKKADDGLKLLPKSDSLFK